MIFRLTKYKMAMVVPHVPVEQTDFAGVINSQSRILYLPALATLFSRIFYNL